MLLDTNWLNAHGVRYSVENGAINVSGALVLNGTEITALPDGLRVGCSLDLKNTTIPALPDGLYVGGSLYLRGSLVTTLPNGLYVGDCLYLSGSLVATLPDGLYVGGSLYLQGTSITTLPCGLRVGGSLYLRGTSITTLPCGLRVGSFLDLRDTPIATLPNGLYVGGFLDLRDTPIATLPDDLTAEVVLFDGVLNGRTLAVFDGTGAVVLSTREANGVTIRHCRRAKFLRGNLVGTEFYVASRDGLNAHGDTIREAIEELAFKSGERNVDQYRNLPLDTRKSPEEWAFVYRMVTGACQFGTREFMKSKGVLKDSYTLAEIIEETRGAYGRETFKNVVGYDAETAH